MKTSLNHTYRLVWSDALQTFVPVAECARGRGKGGKKSVRARSMLLSLALLSGAAVQAQLPTGGQVVAGSASMTTQGSTLTVTQTTDRMAADWQSFSIGKGHTVNFVQPGSHAVALNRVLGSDVSVIQGALNANGQVFLVNPNGVLFTKDAQVNVGGMVASTLNISTQDFMAGHYKFEGSSSNAIVNQGRITAHGNGQGGGTVALIAARISNEGTLTAEKGNVLMGAGRKVTLDLGGPVKIQVEEGALDALIEQGGAIKADGGLVYLTAKSAGDLVSTVINHTGITEAQTLATGEKGEIYLMGDMAKGRVSVGGTLDASAPNGGDGGFIETSAAKLAFSDRLNITTAAVNGKTGQWLIDPVDFTVAASGGDITGSALGTMLGSNSVTIQTANTGTNTATEVFGTTGTNGDIFVNDSVTWSSANTLTLNAHRNIEINSPITASHASGKLALKYGQGALAAGNTATYTINAPVSLKDGENFSTTLGSNGNADIYTVVNSQEALQAMALTGNYALGSSLSFTDNWTPIGSDWDPVKMFSGRFDGLGNTIANLKISTELNSGNNWAEFSGLFGVTYRAKISNLQLHGVDIDLSNIDLSVRQDYSFYTGSLVGLAEDTEIKNVIASGRVVVPVDQFDYTGGLVGHQYTRSTALIEQSHAHVAVTGSNSVGGLVGDNRDGNISRSSASGAVMAIRNLEAGGSINLGGLVGFHAGGAVSNAYSTGSVTAQGTLTSRNMGGFVGLFRNGGYVDPSIANAYASGQVFSSISSGDDIRIGGFIGNRLSTGTPAIPYGVITNVFWDSDSTTQTNAIGAGELTATRLYSTTNSINAYAQNTYAAFNFDNTWWMSNSATRPFLRSEWQQDITNAHQLQLMAMKPSHSYTLANDIDLQPALGRASEMWKDVLNGSSFQGSWLPIGHDEGEFRGSLDGKNYTISNLTISPSNWHTGFFGYAYRANISYLTLSNVNVSSNLNSVGALAGVFNEGTINNVHVSGAVSWSTGGYGNPYGVGGLVGYMRDSSVNNSSSSVNVTSASANVGGLIGKANFSTATGHTLFRNYATGSVTGKTGTGGLVGALYGDGDGAGGDASPLDPTMVTVSQSYATGAVNGGGDDGSGGLIGEVWGVKAALEDLYATGAVSNGTGSNHGGLIGSLNAASTLTRAYATGAVSVAGGGGLIGSNTGAGATNVVSSYWDTETTGKVTSAGGTAKTTAQMKNSATYTGWDTSVWGFFAGRGAAAAGYEVGEGLPFLTGVTRDDDKVGSVRTLFDGGWGGQTANQQAGADGTAYGVSNWNQLQNINLVLGGGYSFELKNNLDTSSTGYAEQVKNGATLANGGLGWKPIGSLRPLVYDTAEEEWTASGSDRPFVGVFDGKNNSITGLTIQRPTELPGSPAANEAIDSSGVGLFGYVSGSSSEIRDLKLIDPVVKGYQLVGAVVGFMEEGNLRHLTAENIAVQGGGYYVGGIVGSLGGNATGLLASGGQVTGAASGMGGVLGYNEGSVTQSSADVNVTSQRDEAGGLVGNNSGTITASSASGAVSGKGQVGGLVGYSDGSIASSHALGDVTNTGTSDGAGGLVGTSEGSITDSYASGNVTSPSASYAGGLVGYSDGNISLSYASGEVRGEYGVGGLVGWANSWSGALNTIEKSHASGLVIATDENSGGLVGIAEGTKIENSYASGSVTGTRTVGGLVGSFGGESRVGGPQIINSYAIGPVTGTSNVGGLVGYDSSLRTNNYNSVVSSFWDKQNTGQTTSAGGVGKTTAEMQDIALYSGWSIEDDTSLTDSYARLTMTATGTVWKIKSVANTSRNGGNTDSGGTDNNGGSGSGTGSSDQGTGSSGSGSSGSGSSASGGTGGATDTATGSNGGTSDPNTGDSSENADSATQSPQLTAAIQSAQQAAQQAARQTAGPSNPISTGPGRSSVPTSALTGFNPGLALGTASATGAAAGGSPAVLSLSGGLAFVNVNASPAESTGSGGQATGNAVAAMPEGAGRDPAGFMRVFVVNGGINLPTQASDAAVPGQGVN